jgi:assimilatory nitrate reductase catalytic subunit
LRDWWERGAAVDAVRAYLLLPVEAPPGASAERGRVLCSCHGVAEREIELTLDGLSGPASASLAALQAKLKCGTECGSCLPELRRMIELRRAAA